MICEFPNCENRSLPNKTYVTTVTARFLCSTHHGDFLSCLNSTIQRSSFVSSKHRWFVWFSFVEKTLKPKQQHLTRSWMLKLRCFHCGQSSMQWSTKYDSWICTKCDSIDIGTVSEYNTRNSIVESNG